MSSEHIKLNQITDTYVPGNKSEFNISNALTTLPINVPKVAVVAQMGIGSTATANIPISCASVEESIAQSGAGSVGHLTIKALLESNPKIELYNVPVSDGSGTQATGTIVVANVPTSTGYLEFWIGKERVQVAVSSGDAVNDIASAINTAIGLKTHNMPITTGVSTATVTLTAINDGLLGNNIPVSYKNHGILTTTITVVQIGDVIAGTVDPDITTALTNIETDKYDFIVVTNNDSTNLALLKTHLTNVSHPDENKPSVGVFGYTGVMATFQTLAGTTLNHERILGAYYKYTKTSERGHSLDYEIAGAVCGRLASKSDPAKPYNNEPVPGIVSCDKAQRLTEAQKNTIINDGGTPLHVVSGETVSICRAVSTRTTNASGVEDKALIDITTIRSLDYGNQYILRRESQTFYQAKKTNRTKLALKSLVLDCIRILSLAEIWNFPNSNDEVIVEDDLSNVNQLVVKVPAYVVPGLHNIANQINLLIR